MSNMVAERRDYDAWVTAVPRDSSEEELWDAPEIAEEQVLVNGFFGNRHWKRCRAHQEPGNCSDRVQFSGGCCGDNCGKGGRSMIEGTAGEPETVVWIAVDGLSDVRGTTQLTFTEVVVANVVMNAEIVAHVVTTTAIMQSFPVEMIGIKKMKVAESSMIGRIMEIG